MFTLRRLFFIYLLRFATCSSYWDEKRLREDLLTNHSKNIRPVKDSDNQIGIRVDLTTLTIHELNLNTGYLVTHSILQLTWTDEILTWEPKDYGNITKINVYSDEVWMPSVFVCNSDEGMNKRSESIYAFQLSNTGEITFVEAKTLRTFCDINVHKYPFDEHICYIVLCVEEHDALHTPITNFTYKIDTAKENHFWDVEFKSTNIYATIYLTRKISLGSVATVLPAAILSYLTVWVFVLPPESGEKVSLATTLLLADVVYMVEMGRMLSVDSKFSSMFVLYLIVLTMSSGFYTIGVIIICKMQVLSKENPDNKRPGNNITDTANLETTDEYEMQENPDNKRQGNNKAGVVDLLKRKMEIKMMGCDEYRRLDNILLRVSSGIFVFFSLIFTVFLILKVGEVNQWLE